MKSSSPFRTCIAFAAVLFSPAIFAADASPSPAEKAAALIRQNDLAAAEALLAPLTAAGAQDAAAFYQLGQLRTKQKRPDEAVTAFEKAAQLDATRAEYFSSYAIALSTKLQSANFMMQAALAPKMRKAFARSVELDANHVPGLIGLSRYYSNAPEIAGGSLAKAKEYAERVRALQPFVGELELGQVAERAEDFSAALGHFEAASKLQSQNATAPAAAGRMLAKLGRHEEARARFEKALELDPKREAVRKALAELGAKK